MRRAALILLVAAWPSAARAVLTETQIGKVELSPSVDAQVPMTRVFKGIDGRDMTIGDAIGGRPTLLLPADFTCKQICGPALSIAAGALSQTGLRPGLDYSIVVVGLDAKDSLDDARRFTSGQLGGPGVSVLSGSSEAIQSVMGAIGYRFQSDEASDAIAHPVAFVTLTAQGRVSHALSSLALQPADLRLALLEAGEGKIGGFTGRIALLCYGFDAVHGIYSRKIATILQVAGGLTVLLLVAALGFMAWRTAKRGAAE